MYRDKYLKYKSKYNNFKLLGGSPETVYYSDNNNEYLPGKYYQLVAIKEALSKDYSDKRPSLYDIDGIKFYLYPLNSDKLIFLCVRENNTFFFLKYQPATKLRYEKKIAVVPTEAIYNDKPFTINVGKQYYYDTKLKKIPVGLHESINPPIDMDGIIAIDLKEEI